MIRRASAISFMGLWLCLCLGFAAPQEGSADWPMWRHDAAHTASTPRPLPDRLQLQWTRDLPPLRPGWPDQPRMQLDAEYEPVVLGQTMFVPSSRTDSLAAYDTRTGIEKWTFFTDGPVRYPAAAAEGRVYFTSDDGHLYCLDADKGSLLWKFLGGPRDRRILGNERLISTWPARGAPVVADGTVYFAAGIWPFMGTFLYALDARTGKIAWSNEGDGSTYMMQPHNTEAFAGVAPQGPMTVIGDRLLVPGGRSVPACYDRKSGKIQYFKFADNGRRGGLDVAAAGSYFYAGGSAYDLGTGAYAGDVARAIVVTPETIWYAGKTKDILLAKPPVATTIETIDRKGSKNSKPMWKMSPAQTVEAPRIECMIRAGNKFYLGTEGRVAVFEKNKEIGRIDVPGTAATLLAADDRLFVVTREGRIQCFGAEPIPPMAHAAPREGPSKEAGVSDFAETMTAGGVEEGYAVRFTESGARSLVCDLHKTRLRVIFVQPEAEQVQATRDSLLSCGGYGDRGVVHRGEPRTFSLPPYFASAIDFGLNRPPGMEDLRKLYPALRPYGGKLFFPARQVKKESVREWIEAAGLLGAEIEEVKDYLVVVRAGALPGAGNWTHEHADAANTRVSKDQIARAPLGMLWFGGPSHEGILPRHGHGPQPQVIDGRLVIEGIDKMRALDIYTGRLLWEAPLPGVGDFYNNVVHQAGANGTGTNYVSTSDGIYVAYRNKCLRLDPATGKTLMEFTLPVLGKPSMWGYINIVGDLLIGGAEPLLDVASERKVEGGFDDPLATQASIVQRIIPFKGDNDTLSASRRLVALDRHTGKVLWQAQARAAFRHNAICAGGGRLYAIDRLSGPQVERMKKKNEIPKTPPRIVAFDLKDGGEVWESEDDVFGTWLSYSEGRDVLVEAGRVARDTLIDEAKGMRAHRGSDGVELWKKNYLGPAMIHGDTILMADRACDLRTGAAVGRLNPFTQQPMEWSWFRNYGCNTPAASEHLMTFRSGAAGYFDLANDGGTGNFGGFKTSCTNNLVVAGGIITVPDYTRTCICSYQNQASVALVPMPEAEEWTYFGVADDKLKGPVRRIGVNLGAAGDRRAEDGTLWVEHPSVGGKSPNAPVSMNPDKPAMFRKSALRISGAGPAWVASSGAKGLKELTLSLDKDAKEERLYTVLLHFVEPDGMKPGERVFDVLLQGQPVLTEFDIAKEAGGPDVALVREFREVKAKKEIKVAFKARVSVSILCGIEVAPTCRIPLFRYALERWKADPYEFVVRGDSTIEVAGANALVHRVAGPVRLEVAFPSGRGPLLWSGPPDPKAVAALLDSPARREILHRLLTGESAVWVLVESGEKDRDDVAANLLDSTLRDLEESLKLPEPREDPEDALTNKTVPLKLDFSVLRVSPQKEPLLVKMLLQAAVAHPGPMAFPVFGRGRVMAPTEISVEGVRRAAEALVAPCTNTAKSSVPGVDLLMAADWTGLVGEVPGKVTEIPAGEMLQHPRPEEELVGTPGPETSSPRSQLTWLLAAGAVILLLLLSLRPRRPS
jgi:outer membrane protein assembly factor BamB